jgi:hypothetical protein
MTSKALVVHAGGNKRLKVITQIKDASGEWVDKYSPNALPNNVLHTGGDLYVEFVWDTQRLVIEEFGEFTS